MSLDKTHIVPKHVGDYPNSEMKAKEILTWLQDNGMVENILSDCILTGEGYRILPGIISIYKEKHPNPMLFDLRTLGVEVHYGERKVFHPMEGADLIFRCPKCDHVVDDENFISFFEGWYNSINDYPQCNNCKNPFHISSYKTSEPWAFSNVGITFWNSGNDFEPWFLEKMKNFFGTEIIVVYAHI